MSIEQKLAMLIEGKDVKIDKDLLEAVTEKLEEKKHVKEDDEDMKKDDEGKESADQVEDEPTVKIDNPIDPNLVSSDEDGDGVPDDEESEKTSVKESVVALLGDEFSEDFKLKAATIFEAAVKDQVTKIEEELKAQYEDMRTRLQEEFDEKFTTEVKRIEEETCENVDGYLGYLSEEWVRKNELAIESGIKAELVESFINGMKNLFEEHYIDLPEEKYDVVGQLAEEKHELEKALAEAMVSVRTITENHNNLVRDQIITESAKDFTDLDFERFKTLIEDFDFESEDTFRKKVDIVKKTFFEGREKDVQKKERLDEEFTQSNGQTLIVEEKILDTEDKPDTMKQYLKYLTR